MNEKNKNKKENSAKQIFVKQSSRIVNAYALITEKTTHDDVLPIREAGFHHVSSVKSMAIKRKIRKLQPTKILERNESFNPIGKITSRGHSENVLERRPDVLKTSPYAFGPICNRHLGTHPQRDVLGTFSVHQFNQNQ